MGALLNPQLGLFYAFSALIVLCAIMVISSRNPVTSAIFLVLDLFLLAGVYAMMNAHFIATIQILVYAGAIVVLFMFVIMLLNLSPDAREKLRVPASEFGVLLMTLVGFMVVAVLLAQEQPGVASGELTTENIAAAGGNTYAVGMVLFTKYLWPFELASILILLAIVASIVIAKKDKVPTRVGAKNKGAPHAAR